MFRILLISLVLLISSIGAGLYFSAAALQQFERQPLAMDSEATLWLEPGDSYSSMVRELSRLGVTGADWRWQWIGRLRQPVLQAGEYRIAPGTTPDALLEQIQNGVVVSHRFTVIEGWTTARLRQQLASDSRLQQTTRDWEDVELMQSLGCTDCFAEGQFLPETYFFVRGDRDLDLLQRAYSDMQTVLNNAWETRDAELPLTGPAELLVLASLVEMETTDPAELGQVAGVFKRRLQAGMRLQTDPTVVYGIEGPFDGRIRRVHLTTDHPWNTYTRHGLPPTPISLPGVASIQAAARPADGDTFYFVARGDGTHQFSRTLAEHNRAVDRYIRGRN